MGRRSTIQPIAWRGTEECVSIQGARPQPDEEEGDPKKPLAKALRLSLPLLEKQLESYLLSRREREIVHLVL